MWQEILSYFANEENVTEQIQEKIMETKSPNHPFYPTDLKLPTYIENTHSMEYLLGSFAVIAAVITLASSLTIYQKQIAIKDKIAFVWLIITGSIHIAVEGYFGYYHETLQSDNFLIAQWWKEYSLSDSRYLSSDPFVLNMERITAVCWGPGAYLAAIAIYQNWPSRHIMQLVTSLGQLYGLVLYYWTSSFQEFPHSRPEAWYFWGYFVGVNSLWLIFPGYLFLQSWLYLVDAVKESQKSQRRRSKKID